MPVYLKKQTLGNAGSFLKDEAGAAAIVMALLTPVLIGGLAFGAEIGFWELQKRKLQNAADTAAHAAATQLRNGETNDATLKTTAFSIAGKGGYKGEAAGITLQQPPTSGAFAGNNMAVHVEIASTIPRRFSGIFDTTPVAFTVGATALLNNGRPACVLALAPSASGAISVAGSTTVTLGGCDLAANSISNSSITQQGASTLTADCVSTVGGVSFGNPGNVTLDGCPAPIVGGPKTADPYAGVAQPTVPLTCATNAEKQHFTKNNGTGNPKPTYGPGGLDKAYCGSGNEHIRVQVNMDPGVYVFNGGNWNINSTATLTGDGVTIFLTGDATLSINGGATIDLSAPTTGVYAGIVIFFDRNQSGSSTINGGSNFSMVGAVYGANTNLTFSGNTTGSGPGECTQVIGYTVRFTGNSGFNTDCSASGTKEIRVAQSIRIVE